MSAASDRQTPGEAVAGLLASAAIFLSAIAVAYRPARLVPVAAVLALVATAMAGQRHRWLVLAAIAAVGVGWLLGMTAAVVTNNPLY